MSPRQRLVTSFGALLLALGPVVVLAPAASAVPGGPAATEVDFPFGEQAAPKSPEGKQDKTAQKAEKFGGSLTEEMIDLITGVIKCGLNIATDTIKCPL